MYTLLYIKGQEGPFIPIFIDKSIYETQKATHKFHPFVLFLSLSRVIICPSTTISSNPEAQERLKQKKMMMKKRKNFLSKRVLKVQKAGFPNVIYIYTHTLIDRLFAVATDVVVVICTMFFCSCVCVFVLTGQKNF